jgi:nucleoside-diphosphate-sugar epimerase
MAMNDGRVVSNFIVQALSGDPITVYGDGSQIRSLCYVDDLITGLIALFDSEDAKGPINLGNPEPITMMQLAEEIINLTNSSSEIVFEPLPGDDPITREPNIDKARSILGWNPKIGRSEGLRKTVDFFRNTLIKKE